MGIEQVLIPAFAGLGKVTAHGSVTSGAVTVDPPATSAVDTVTIGANTTFTMPDPAAAGAGARKTLLITQDATGSRTGTFTGVKFPGGTHTLSVTAGDVDKVEFVSDGTTWYGTLWLAEA
ncbi:MAG: hypothetical protein KGH75_00370 [Rhodospirillales bacterium]|nr:hypothetical protein [Rhodospirillales bacterium]